MRDGRPGMPGAGPGGVCGEASASRGWSGVPMYVRTQNLSRSSMRSMTADRTGEGPPSSKLYSKGSFGGNQNSREQPGWPRAHRSGLRSCNTTLIETKVSQERNLTVAGAFWRSAEHFGEYYKSVAATPRAPGGSGPRP